MLYKFVIIAPFTYKEIQKIEPLLDYNRSHIVTFSEYLEIMQQKVLNKKVTKQIKKPKKKKGRKRKQGQQLNPLTWLNEHFNIKKHIRTNFNKAWFLIAIINANNKFHHNFQVGYKVHPIGYRGV